MSTADDNAQDWPGKKPEEMGAEQAAQDEQTPDMESATEDSAPEAAAEDPAQVDPMEQLQAELAKWKDLALRSQADLENFRKRMHKEKADAIKFANSTLLNDLLPIVDNFHFGLDAARQEAEGGVVFQGMSMVMRQLTDFLGEYGVEEVPAEGQSFDPNLHDAVKQEHSDSVPEGVVIAVIRRGYKLRDRLLRAANVVVSKGPESENPATEPEA